MSNGGDPPGLPVSSVIAVSINLTPPPAAFLNFNTLLILGDSDVIDVHQRLRTYTALSGVATDFGTTAPEYFAAKDYFSQLPNPTTLYVGRWAQSATHGLNLGGALTPTQQLLSNWTSITTGNFHISIDGAAHDITCGTFAGATTLPGIAAIIQTALQAIGTGGYTLATCVWTGSQFLIKSGSTGPTSSVSALSTVSGNPPTDISGQLMMTTSTLTYLQNGIASESAVSAVTLFDTGAGFPGWYGLMFAAGTGNADIHDSDHSAIAAYIEGAGNPHLYGLTTSEAAALSSPDTTSIGALLHAAGYNRTLYQYSSTDPYAVAAIFGNMFTVNLFGSNTAIILMFQQETGVTAETLSSAQGLALSANKYNYFAAFQNNTNILVNGQVASGQYIDTVWGIDWLANTIQTNVYNLLFTIGTKVPQTDAGMHQIATQIEAALKQGVANGLLAAGVWNAGGFGQLSTGDYMTKGYYIFTPTIASQSPAARAARQSVPFQVACKLAGGVQQVSITVNVNS